VLLLDVRGGTLFEKLLGKLLRVFFFKLPQNRHPERSASQIGRVTLRLWRGVEEPVLSVAEGTAAMLVGSCSWELSGHRSPTTGYSVVTGTVGIDRAMRLIQVAGNANVKRACMAAVNVDVGADEKP
jgi:hypothetical protein